MLASLFFSLLLLFLPGEPAFSSQPYPAALAGPGAAATADPLAALPDYAQIPNDLFIGNRLLLGAMSLADVRQKRIKVIRQKTEADRFISYNTEQFDEHGHTVYRRLWWNLQPDQPGRGTGSGYSEFFACKYGPDGRIAAASTFADSLHTQTLVRSVYRYTRRGQLKQAGTYRLTYHPSGLLQSVAGGGSTEWYYYNARAQLTRVEFGHQPGVLACGNSTTQWQGEYNADHLLRREAHVGIQGHSYELTYDAAGQLIRRTSTDGSRNYECLYTYQDGLLAQAVEKFSGREFSGPQQRTTTYAYERY